ncbi:pyridoxal phosphate-dependent aminotransferase [Patescibacteria group bacterium]|nr:pyridoxal phosphate-dependent aminotransferase [Patescibacteria group bacterium]
MAKKFLDISKRAKETQFSPIRKFVPLLHKVKKKGIKVFELHIGQPDLPTPKEILRKIKGFKGKVLAYAPSTGIPEVKAAWQKYYKDAGINFDVSEIIVTTGGSEAVLLAFATICNPGEEIIVFEPFYTNYNGYASVAGIKLVPLRTFAKTGFHLPNKKEIEKKINKKTRGILICNPNNPTGTVYKKEELKMIVEIAKKHNLFVLSDEVYREFVYDGKKHYSMISFPDIRQRVILLDSVSKRFSACGARIGCLASKNKKVIKGATKFAQARLSSPMIEQLAVVPLLKNSQKYIKKIIAEYKKRRDIVFEALQKIPRVLCQKPKGAFYITVKLPIEDSDHFAEWLLTKFSWKGKTVMVAPAAGFYATGGLGKDEIRIAFVLSSLKLRESMKVFKKGLEKYKKGRKVN